MKDKDIERLVANAYQRGHDHGYAEGAEKTREIDSSGAYAEGWSAAWAFIKANGLLRLEEEYADGEEDC